jgi:F0F1-type ATP synthase delta subunit
MTKSYSIWKSIVTKSDLNELENLLDQLESHMFINNSSLNYQQLIESSANPDIAEVLVDSLSENDSIKLIVDNIRKDIEKLSFMHLSFSQRPTEKFLKIVGKWIKENINEKVVIDFDIKKEILGGAEISYLGKFGDYSLKKKLDNWWVSESSQLRKDLSL